jgi:hypothetical protein
LPPLILRAEEADMIVERLAPLIANFLHQQAVAAPTTAKAA